MLAGRHLLFVKNEYAYLFIWVHQPLRYQREEENKKVLITNQQIIG